MQQASYNLIECLRTVWLHLSEGFPDRHFRNKPADEYIDCYIQSRFAWYRALSEPDGSGTGGTIVNQLAAGSVIRDLQTVIEQTVYALRGFDYPADCREAWLRRWRESVKQS
jgi:hypothetical protein